MFIKNSLFRNCIITLFVFLMAGCDQSNLPFKYKYKAKDVMVITYQGIDYELRQSEKKTGLPFTYEFEIDGDLDLTLDGKLYEIESPYDNDSKTKKKKKTTKKTKARK